MKPDKRTILLTLAQAVLVLALILTIVPALLPTVMLVSLMQVPSPADTSGLDPNSIVLCLRDLALGGCLVCAEMEALGILSRMKKDPACQEKNAASLHRIVIALLIASGISLLLGNAIIPYLLMLLSASNALLERLLLPLMLLALALIIRLTQRKMQHTAEGN